MTELLAPAGSFEKLKAAIYCGADAVYFGLKKFNARKNAQNFELDEVEKVVQFCHSFGAKAYLTLNTILNDKELEKLENLIPILQKVGVDAVIVQDLGVLNLIKRVAPSFRIHASTQMGINSLSGVRFLKKLGVSRAILSRELTLCEISEVCKEGIEIEVFVHGALCFCFSGQCFMSAMLGGRSANRGNCAQPCRLPFSVSKPPRPDLSLKDLCCIDLIQKLKEVGVCSFKIEGRMKRPEYVAAATMEYRKALDEKPYDKDILLKVFSREGFTNGYIENDMGRKMFGVRSRKDAPEEGIYSKIRQLYRIPLQKFYVDVSLTVKKNQPVVLKLRDSSFEVKISGDLPEKAKTRALNENQVRKCFEKLGQTIYRLKKFELLGDCDLYVSNSQINKLKKRAVLALAQKRAKFCASKTSRQAFNFDFNFRTKGPQAPKNGQGRRLRAECEKFQQVVCEDCFELISLNMDEILDNQREILPIVKKVGILMPQVSFEKQSNIIQKINKIKKMGVLHATIQNLGQIPLLEGFSIHAGLGLNIANSQSVQVLESIGFCDFIVSAECCLKTISKIAKKIPLGAVVFGRLPLMVSRNCPISKSCKECGNNSCLKDRKGKLFPVRCQNKCHTIFNSDVLWMADRQKELENVDFEVLKFTIETKSQAKTIAQNFIQNAKPKSNYTRGLYYRGF